jgi:restriction system protein
VGALGPAAVRTRRFLVAAGCRSASISPRSRCVKIATTDEELAERLSIGGSRFDSRVQWALTHLVQGGLLTRPRRGHVQIMDRGKEVLAAKPDRVDIQLLSRFEEYREFRMRTRAGSG